MGTEHSSGRTQFLRTTTPKGTMEGAVGHCALKTFRFSMRMVFTRDFWSGSSRKKSRKALP